MNCQKCRQPLKLDGSLDDLNPAAYDLLVSSSSPHTAQKKSPGPSNSSIPQTQRQPRKALYDQASQDAGPPIFKRQSAGQPRDSAMSFIYLTQSQIGHSGSQAREQSATPKKVKRSISSKGGEDVGTTQSDEVDRMNRLFEILSSRSDIDHPVCVECTDMLLEGLQQKLEDTSRERDIYVKHLKSVQADQPTAAEVKTQKEALRKAEQEKDEAMKLLRDLETEKEKLDDEILALEKESKELDAEEEGFWRERNAFASEMAEFQAERDSITVKYANDSQLLEKLRRSNVYNDTFCISHDGSFATINGLRLGRLSNKPVDWPEINAAWGHALLLVVTVADKLGCKFQGYDPQPMGSTSKIIKYEVQSPSSSRLGSTNAHNASGPPPKKHVLELYSSGDMPIRLTFMHRHFNNAMVAFLELVRQLGAFVHRETQASGNALKLPYSIDGDKIADVSIKLGIAQDEAWTKACKLTLTCCKFLLAHASNVSSLARA